MECSICLDPLITDNNDTDSSNSVFTLKSCRHQFHYGCIHQWLQNNATCPICRDYVHQTLPCRYITNRMFPSLGYKTGFFRLRMDNHTINFSSDGINITTISFFKIFSIKLLNYSVLFDVRYPGLKPKIFQYKFPDPNVSLRIFNFLNETLNNIYIESLRNNTSN